MIVEHGNVVCGTTRDSLDAFVRVVRLPHRRLIALAEGHTCGWDAGAKDLSGPVLDSVEHALAMNPAASLESLFDAAREAFLIAAEPYPEDDLVGGPAAQLTMVELLQGQLRARMAGRFEPVIVRDGIAHCEAERPGFNFIDRIPRTALLVDRPIFKRDLVIVSPQWVSDLLGQKLPGILEQLARAHREPRGVVEAALSRWKDDVRRAQESGGLIGEPKLALAAIRV